MRVVYDPKGLRRMIAAFIISFTINYFFLNYENLNGELHILFFGALAYTIGVNSPFFVFVIIHISMRLKKKQIMIPSQKGTYWWIIALQFFATYEQLS